LSRILATSSGCRCGVFWSGILGVLDQVNQAYPHGVIIGGNVNYVIDLMKYDLVKHALGECL